MNNDFVKVISYLNILELPIDSEISKEIVVNAYRKLVQIYHPDVANNRYKDGKKFIELQKAKDYLINNITSVNILIMTGFSSVSSKPYNDYVYEKWKQEEEFKRRKAEEDKIKREREEAERKRHEEIRRKREAEEKKRREEEKLNKHINESLAYLKNMQENINNKYQINDLRIIEIEIYELYHKISNHFYTNINDIDREINILKEKICKFKTIDQIEKERKEFEDKKQMKKELLNEFFCRIKEDEYLNEDYLLFQKIFNDINTHIETSDSNSIENFDIELVAFQETVTKTKKLEELKKIALIKKRVKIVTTSILVSICFICMVIFIVKVPIPYFRYNNAIKLAENKKYQESNRIFESLGNYKDSNKYSKNTLIYLEVQKYIVNGQYDLAIETFKDNNYLAKINNNLNNSYHNKDKEGYEINISLTDYQIDIYSNSLVINLLNEYIPVDYIINFELEGGIFDNNCNLTYNIESSFELPIPIKDGYVFDGWLDTNSNLITMVSPGRTGEMSLKAIWSLMKYPINYNLDGGTNSVNNPNEYTIEDTVILENPLKSGYLFTGWYYKNELIEQFDTNMKQPIEIDAKWEPIFTLKSGIITGLTELARKKCSTLVIPSSIDGINIYEIGDKAFNSSTTLFEVTISNGINVIGDSCFSNCPYLKRVTINSSDILLKDRAFENCVKLSTVIINGSINSVGDFAFANCVSLYNIDTNLINKSIGKYAFMNCNSLELFDFSNEIYFIGERAFYGCSNLTFIEIPVEINTLNNGLFANCSLLTTVKLTNNIKYIESDVFYNCTSLHEICFAGSNDEWEMIEFFDGWNLNCIAFDIKFIGDYENEK